MHELQSIRDEIVDRFGRYPDQVDNLFILSRLRLKARELGASEVVHKGEEYIFYCDGKVVYKMD